MKRRNILTALFTAPLALLASAAVGMGRRKSRRRDCCEQELGYCAPHRGIPLVTLTLTPTGMPRQYNIRIDATVDVPERIPSDPMSPQYTVKSVDGQIVDANNPSRVLVFGPLAMQTAEPPPPNLENDGIYYRVWTMVTIPQEITSIKGIATATETLVEFAGSVAYPVN